MLLIDQFLPTYHVSSRHEIRVDAPIERVFAALHRVDLRRGPLSRLLMLLRALPAIVSGRPTRGPSSPITLVTANQGGFINLGEKEPTEILLGLVGQFWSLSGRLKRNLTPEAFLAFEELGFAKATWNVALTTLPSGGTRVVTETRVYCTDEASLRKFRRYWSLIRLGSGLIRIEMLRLLRREAEGATLRA